MHTEGENFRVALIFFVFFATCVEVELMLTEWWWRRGEEEKMRWRELL